MRLRNSVLRLTSGFCYTCVYIYMSWLQLIAIRIFICLNQNNTFCELCVYMILLYLLASL